MSPTVGRFAPSPSGRMHLGNLFSALLAWASVRSKNGKMVLRIEDLDQIRCTRENASLLKEDLLWLGLDWDEEAPYQSTRNAAYEEALAQLQAHVYPCWCSRGDLNIASAPHATDGHVIYHGRCRNLTTAEKAAKTTPPSLRLAVPDKAVLFQDGLQGPFRENLYLDCGDFVLRKADGVFAYQLAVVVDDAACGVTEVVRGRDLLSSTPRQIYLQQLLGYPQPDYYHVPLLIAADGRRLSKREKDLDMGSMRKTYTPEQLIGKLAHLAGLLERPEAVSPRELAAIFSWDKIKRDDIVI